MSDQRAQILELIRTCGTSTITTAEAIQHAGGAYYCNASFHIGQILTRLVKNGQLVRVNRGIYAINTKKYSF